MFRIRIQLNNYVFQSKDSNYVTTKRGKIEHTRPFLYSKFIFVILFVQKVLSLQEVVKYFI